jgi:hypothetical protein
MAAWVYFHWEAKRDDVRREAAFASHTAEPDNPIHLARFVALSSMAASSRTVAWTSLVAAIALNLCIGW